MNLILLGGFIVVVCILYYLYTKSSTPSPTQGYTPFPTISSTLSSKPSLAPFSTPSSAAPFITPSSAPFITPSTAPFVITPSPAVFSEITPAPFSKQSVIAFLTTPPPTLAPTTPAPTVDSNDPIVGDWNSYIVGGNQLGPVTITFIGGENGINNYYIEGNQVTDDLSMLEVNPKTLSAKLMKRTDLLKGDNNIVMTNGKAFKIGSADSFAKLQRTSTVDSTYVDPIVGEWSYISSGTRYGTVNIISTGGKDGLNTYYIDGENMKMLGDGEKMLTVDPKELKATLTIRPDMLKNVPILISNGKAFKISNEYINLFRNPSIDPNYKDPIVGNNWTYSSSGQTGIITIVNTGGKDGINTYYMDGDILRPFGDDYKILQVDTNQSPPTATMSRRPDLMSNAPIVILGATGAKKAVRMSSPSLTLTRPSR